MTARERPPTLHTITLRLRGEGFDELHRNHHSLSRSPQERADSSSSSFAAGGYYE